MAPFWVSVFDWKVEETPGKSKRDVLKAKGIYFTGGLRGALLKHWLSYPFFSCFANCGNYNSPGLVQHAIASALLRSAQSANAIFVR